MKTNDLINALAADAGPSSPGTDRSLAVAGPVAVVLAAAVFAMLLGPRVDIATAAETPRFLFKFVVTLALAVPAVDLMRRMSRPGTGTRRPGLWLLAAPALLASAVIVELVTADPAGWSMLATGKNAMACLTSIPIIAAGPLILALAVLRQGAPTRPGLAGVVAGLAAGALGATFYAAHCTDDSPLFVALWYPIAVGLTASAGGIVGRYVLRW